jgi:hypothetical protein
MRKLGPMTSMANDHRPQLHFNVLNYYPLPQGGWIRFGVYLTLHWLCFAGWLNKLLW